jgi:hypothetical protein
MPAPLTRQNIVRRNSTLDDTVAKEIERLAAEGELDPDIYKTSRRCYICCEKESQDLVNKLIAASLTNREITQACESINARRALTGDDRIINSRIVYKHRQNHFNIDKPSQAVYRAIAERRAAEANLDTVNGIGHHITTYAVLESMMVKGYQALTDEIAPPPTYKETMEASVRLHEMTNRDAGQRKMADLMSTMGRIIDAAQRFVPAENRDAFLAMVEGRTEERAGITQAITEKVAETTAIKEFAPSMTMDPDDEL